MTDFWKQMHEAAKLIKDASDWMKAGINLNPKNFETFMPKKQTEKNND